MQVLMSKLFFMKKIKKVIFICISQFNEAKMLKEAEHLQIRKKQSINNLNPSELDLQFNSPDLNLPTKIIECDKMKKFKFQK